MIDPELDRAMLHLEDVARRLGVSVKRVRDIPPDELPYVQLTTRGARLYRPADLERFLMRRTVTR